MADKEQKSEQKLEPVLWRWQVTGDRQLVDKQVKKLSLPDFGDLRFWVDCGEPVLPLKIYGRTYHRSNSEVFRFAIDQDDHCWTEAGSSLNLSKVTVDWFLTYFSDQEQLQIAAVLGLPTEECVCSCCGGTGKQTKIKKLK